MAVKSYRVDDLDGKTTEGVETVTFSYEGKAYEIDLSEEHRAEFAEVMGKYTEVAELVTSGVRRTSASTTQRKTGPNDAGDIRWWANETEDGQALLAQLKIDEVKPRGQINKEVRSGWEDAGKPRKS